MPHVHIIVWVSEAYHCRAPEDINKIICAEIPDKETDSIGYEAVAQFMIHGPCGACNTKSSCMQKCQCTKHFPKPFTTTTIDHDGFPVYRRRDDKMTITRKGIEVDNRYKR